MYQAQDKSKTAPPSKTFADSIPQLKRKTEPEVGFVDNRPETVAQRKLQAAMQNSTPSSPIQKKEKGGLPNHLKSGLEHLSGYSMDDVNVHYNSSRPAQLNAHAYAQGSNIHIGPGQEKQLPHEAWHVVQQKQGRVKSTSQTQGVAINSDPKLEQEADIMGNKASALSNTQGVRNPQQMAKTSSTPLQMAAKFVFTNVSEEFQTKADQIIAILLQHADICEFVGDRTCFIILSKQKVPADITDRGSYVEVHLASWYFKQFSIGYVLGMLTHEFGIHHVADYKMEQQGLDLADEGDQFEKVKKPAKKKDQPEETGVRINTGVTKKGKGGKAEEIHVTTLGVQQPDHIFGAVYYTLRGKAYIDVLFQMAEAMVENQQIPPEEVTNLLDCFLMDVSSIIAGNDSRQKSATNLTSLTEVYRQYKAILINMSQANKNREGISKLFPPDKDKKTAFGNYFSTAKKWMQDSSKSMSAQHAYDPTVEQTNALSQRHLQLRRIAPDGRCVFGALAFILNTSAKNAVQLVLQGLKPPNQAVRNMIENAGYQVDDVIQAIKKSDWAGGVGDIILEVAATILGVGVTVLLPDGSTFDVNGGGPLIVRVISPLEHYHATSNQAAGAEEEEKTEND